MKKAFFAFALVLLCSSAMAESITNYTVPRQLPLNENLTIYGKYVGDTTSADVLCAFYIFDLSNTDINRAVIRLNDLYTFSDGSFYAQYQATEPLFRRGMDYNAITKCGTTQTGQKFTITQKEDIAFGIMPQSLAMDMRFWTNPANSFTVFLIAILLLAAAVILYGSVR